jgi:hypothetical protein
VDQKRRCAILQIPGWQPGYFKQQKRWQDAVGTLMDLLDEYLAGRDAHPDGLTDSVIADRLEEALLRDLLDRLAEAELPKG